MPEPGRVLVVEDEQLIRDTLAVALADEGYELRTAADGLEALTTLEEWRPDVIVLDLMMPIMDGPSFRAEQLRRHAVRDIPIVVLSGARDMRATAEQLGASAAISKPFELEDLLATIAYLLGHAPARPSEASPP